MSALPTREPEPVGRRLRWNVPETRAEEPAVRAVPAAGDAPEPSELRAPYEAQVSREAPAIRRLLRPVAEPASPEPREWRPPPRFRDRVWRAVSVPLAAGIVVFIAVLVVAVALVWLRPHSIEAGSDGAGAAGAQALAGSPTEVDVAASQGEVGPASHEDAARVFVHVVGEVRYPGVVELAHGSRVEAAIAAAGGPNEGAVLTAVNLARQVVDGEQIVVPDAAMVEAGLVASASAGTAGLGATTGSADSGGRVSLNTADQTGLESLPGIGPALARRIIDWRSANGGFTSVEQLLDVSGIGSKVYEGLKARVTV